MHSSSSATLLVPLEDYLRSELELTVFFFPISIIHVLALPVTSSSIIAQRIYMSPLMSQTDTDIGYQFVNDEPFMHSLIPTHTSINPRFLLKPPALPAGKNTVKSWCLYDKSSHGT